MTLQEQILHAIEILREAAHLDLEDDQENRRLIHKLRYAAAHLLTRNTIPIADRETGPSTRQEAWEMMKEQCEACRKHGAPTIQGSDHETASNPAGWAHETGSHSWTSCQADNQIVSLFWGEEAE